MKNNCPRVVLAVVAGLAALATQASSAVATPKIVGGTPTTIQEHPATVALLNRNGDQYCGGTLVSPTKVVTAAHCVGGRPPTSIKVLAGRTALSDGGGQLVGIANRWVAPDYVASPVSNDIAVLTLVMAVPYQPLHMASSDDTNLYQAGTEATVLGWGRTSESGQNSPTLLAATVPVQSDAECSNSYGAAYSPQSMLCAGYPNGGADACQSDSGGPLEASGKLIGIVSFGEGCARPGKPGVYMRVAHYYQELLTHITN